MSVAVYMVSLLTLQLKGKVDDFKHHMPLIQTLFNPGLRDRHWESISDIVGYPLAPDEDMCLMKVRIHRSLDKEILKQKTFF